MKFRNFNFWLKCFLLVIWILLFCRAFISNGKLNLSSELILCVGVYLYFVHVFPNSRESTLKVFDGINYLEITVNIVTEAVVFHCITLDFSCCLVVFWWRFKIWLRVEATNEVLWAQIVPATLNFKRTIGRHTIHWNISFWIFESGTKIKSWMMSNFHGMELFETPPWIVVPPSNETQVNEISPTPPRNLPTSCKQVVPGHSWEPPGGPEGCKGWNHIFGTISILYIYIIYIYILYIYIY